MSRLGQAAPLWQPPWPPATRAAGSPPSPPPGPSQYRSSSLPAAGATDNSTVAKCENISCSRFIPAGSWSHCCCYCRLCPSEGHAGYCSSFQKALRTPCGRRRWDRTYRRRRGRRAASVQPPARHPSGQWMGPLLPALEGPTGQWSGPLLPLHWPAPPPPARAGLRGADEGLAPGPAVSTRPGAGHEAGPTQEGAASGDDSSTREADRCHPVLSGPGPAVLTALSEPQRQQSLQPQGEEVDGDAVAAAAFLAKYGFCFLIRKKCWTAWLGGPAALAAECGCRRSLKRYGEGSGMARPPPPLTAAPPRLVAVSRGSMGQCSCVCDARPGCRALVQAIQPL